ncbi:MAG: hypothetical protein ABIH37_02520 [archaeon]
MAVLFCSNYSECERYKYKEKISRIIKQPDSVQKGLVIKELLGEYNCMVTSSTEQIPCERIAMLNNLSKILNQLETILERQNF